MFKVLLNIRYQIKKPLFTSTYFRYISQNDYSIMKFPALTPTMEIGNVAKWIIKEGDKLDLGNPILEIETDKSTVEYEADVEGFIGRIIVKDGTKDVKVGSPIALYTKDKKYIKELSEIDVSNLNVPVNPNNKVNQSDKLLNNNNQSNISTNTLTNLNEDKTTAGHSLTSTQKDASCSFHQASPTGDIYDSKNNIINIPDKSRDHKSENVNISPYAKTLLSQNNYEISNDRGSGLFNSIVAQDLKIKQPVDYSAKSSDKFHHSDLSNEFGEYPLNRFPKKNSLQWTISKLEIPHFYVTTKLNMEKINSFLLNYKDISYHSLIIKALTQSTYHVPSIRSIWIDDYRTYGEIMWNIDMKLEDNYFNPMLPHLNSHTITDIHKLIHSKLDEGFGASTISFSPPDINSIIIPIIRYPQSSSIFISNPIKEFNDTNINIVMSCDHRIIDGAQAAKFLQLTKEYAEEPIKMII